MTWGFVPALRGRPGAVRRGAGWPARPSAGPPPARSGDRTHGAPTVSTTL